jgi:hypothetical protein
MTAKGIWARSEGSEGKWTVVRESGQDRTKEAGQQRREEHVLEHRDFSKDLWYSGTAFDYAASIVRCLARSAL